MKPTQRSPNPRLQEWKDAEPVITRDDRKRLRNFIRIFNAQPAHLRTIEMHYDVYRDENIYVARIK